MYSLELLSTLPQYIPWDSLFALTSIIVICFIRFDAHNMEHNYVSF